MAETDKNLDLLEKRLEDLVRTQIDFQKEIIRIRQDIALLRGGSNSHPGPGVPEQTPRPAPPPVQPPPPPRVADQPPHRPVWPTVTPPPPLPPPRDQYQTGPPPKETAAPNFGYRTSGTRDDRPPRFKDRSELEKFIGENLISKVGIIVLIIGVGIGAKYAIDNGWINPLMRVIFGYGVGFSLLGFAVKLKPKYHNFSAVLLSGGMAIMYFITYFAYALYELIPQPAAFALMVIFTIFTVASAVIYNRQWIAHVGMVGAYAVPFLLSDGSGNYAFLFTYMALVNAGILAISVQKYWKPLNYTAFIFTWATFGGWFGSKYRADEHFFLALIFLGIFFATFYLVTIIQHRLFEERTGVADLILTIFNAFVFYGFSFALLDQAAGYGRFLTLFTYIAAFTLAILVVSIRDYRRPLLFVSFASTWFIFFLWYRTKYDTYEHFYLSAAFLGVFFLIFYLTAIVHSHIFKEKAVAENVAPILTNSFIFFGFGYAMLNGRPEFAVYTGLYTMAHAGFHFLFAAGTSRARTFPIEITYLLAGLVLTFMTIAIPVQFDGSVITLVWAVEGAILFGIGRIKQIPLYEYFSYPLILLASGSLLNDWTVSFLGRSGFDLAKNPYPLANGVFVSAVVYIGSVAAIYYVNRDERYETAPGNEDVRKLVKYAAGAALLAALYNTFRTEIGNYFNYEIVRTSTKRDTFTFDDNDLYFINILWQINYTMLFLTVLGLVNIPKLRSTALAVVNILASGLIVFLFCTAALLILGELRESYLTQRNAEYFYRGIFHIVVRYISLVIAGGLFFTLYRYTKAEFLRKTASRNALTLAFDALFYPALLVTVSSEFINLMDLAGYKDSYKIGLSILWGAFALFLVVVGIYFKKRHLRIGAIVLFAITLGKLFLYDISQLSTIAKTVVFVSVGILMLIVSFLYTRYKSVIFGSDETLPG